MMKFIKTRCKFRKPYFQLLEVMVAVFLILLCAVPALEIYTNMYKKETQSNLINQRDHLVRLIHASITEKLYTHTIPFEDILNGRKFELSDNDLVNGLKHLKYVGSFHFNVIRPKRAANQLTTKKLLSELIISLQNSKENSQNDEIQYTYLVYLERNKLESKPDQIPLEEVEKVKTKFQKDNEEEEEESSYSSYGDDDDESSYSSDDDDDEDDDD